MPPDDDEYGEYFEDPAGAQDGDPDAPSTQEGAPQGQAQQEPAAGTYLELGGQRYTQDQLLPYISMHNWAQADPARWQQLLDWSDGRAQIVPRGAAGAPQATGNGAAETDEDEDPDLTRHQIAAMQGQLERSMLALSHHVAEVGKERVKDKYGLNDQEVENLMGYAVQNRLVNLAAAQDQNPYSAMDKALDMAWRLSTPVEAQEEKIRQRVTAETQRKANWRKPAGGGAPKARTAPAPKTEAEAFDLMVKAIEADIAS